MKTTRAARNPVSVWLVILTGLLVWIPVGTAEVTSSDDLWSLNPPRAPDIPAVEATGWLGTPVDAFILKALEAEGMVPAPSADRRSLIRRATYDLLGVPPEPDEVKAFLDDHGHDAYARLVDRLLASPLYGERWGRYWLDVARFADTKGYTYGGEAQRWMHAPVYRDWVIRSFNADLPYDRFLRLQLAADQIAPEPGHESLAAMGFLTIGRRFLGVAADIIDDRIDVMSRGMLGLTVACARCHDHKFDPVSTKDYYALYGVFQASYEEKVCLDSNGTADSEPSAFDVELRKRLDKWNEEFAARRDRLEDATRRLSPEYWVAALNVESSLPDDFDQILGVDDLNPAITRRWHDYIARRARDPDDPIFSPWRFLRESLSVNGSESEGIVRGPDLSGSNADATDAAVVNRHVRAILSERPGTLAEAAARFGGLLADVHARWKKALAEAAEQGAPAPERFEDPDLEALRWVLYGPDSPAKVPPGSFPTIEDFFDGESRGKLRTLEGAVDDWIAGASGEAEYAVVLKDLPVPPPARVFVRGDPTRRGEEVPRRYLTALSGGDPKPFPDGSGRLNLARRIGSRDNPLTARVMVNRVWLHHFGRGLVATPSDFGRQGEAPSHPALLDYLAVQFMNSGWSVKSLHRLIMLSSTYRQSSVPHPDPGRAARQNDPDNRFLSRMNRRRLDFEGMWDSLLAVAGELEYRMGGKSETLLAGTGSRRRAVYGTVDRRFLPGVYRTFDFANPDAHAPRRHATTVPQQALFFLNSPAIAGRARALTRHPDILGAPDPASTVARLYQRIFQRAPEEAERAAALAFLAQPAPSRVDPPFDPASIAWQYGYGKRDPGTGKILSFSRLPHFTGDAWQGGDAWPDPVLGWVQLTAKGGHTGNDLDHAAIRRWVAPISGTIEIVGTVRHEHEPGDGIRAAIVSSRHGELGSWELHHDSAAAEIPEIEVSAGDTLDFVVDFRGGLNSDMFLWTPELRLKARREPTSIGAETVPGAGAEVTVWNAETDFAGPPPGPRDPMTSLERYAQVLLLSNEFMFID